MRSCTAWLWWCQQSCKFKWMQPCRPCTWLESVQAFQILQHWSGAIYYVWHAGFIKWQRVWSITISTEDSMIENWAMQPASQLVTKQTCSLQTKSCVVMCSYVTGHCDQDNSMAWRPWGWLYLHGVNQAAMPIEAQIHMRCTYWSRLSPVVSLVQGCHIILWNARKGWHSPYLVVVLIQQSFFGLLSPNKLVDYQSGIVLALIALELAMAQPLQWSPVR